MTRRPSFQGQEVLKEAGEEVQKHELEREGPKYADLESGVKGDTRYVGLTPQHRFYSIDQ